EFETIINLLPKNTVRIDFSLLNDMHYYNGILFQGFVDGVSSAVLSGGEYDLLMEKMGRKSKALGFAVYLDKLVFSNAEQFDVDTLVIYDVAVEPAVVAKKIHELQKAGKTVTAQKMVPEMLRYREIIRLNGGN
ncbi:MAG TPA: ATP phosphoribosyltransferase regulatory subunit, partial [Methanocorpusculum sp.]|nr:ATP phosphoribosyltransferase regulatory subunit [Methanocorpusculum sp.]